MSCTTSETEGECGPIKLNGVKKVRSAIKLFNCWFSNNAFNDKKDTGNPYIGHT